jgi:hypothetical protein
VRRPLQVVKAAGGTTAYSDKHTGAYTMLQGANGTGLDQVYNPEQSANGAQNITDSQYDMLHVRLYDLSLSTTPRPYRYAITTIDYTMTVLQQARLPGF